MLGLALHTWDLWRKVEPTSSADFFFTYICLSVPVRMFMLQKPRSHSDEFLVFGFRVLTFLLVSEGTNFPLLRQLSSHAHFPFVEPPLVFSLSFVVLGFGGSECYEAALLTISTFGLLSGGTLRSCVKPSSPATSNMLKQSSVVTWCGSVLTRL